MQNTSENIIVAAETEATKRPKVADVPVGITLDKATMTAIDAADKAFTEWTERDADNIAALDNHRIAEQEDNAALVDASRAGKTTPPPAKAPDLLRAVEYATIRARHAREAADAAADQVTRALDADPHLIENTLAAYYESSARLTARAPEIISQWNSEINRHARVMQNLRFVFRAVRPEIAVDEHRASWSPPQIAWPEPRHLEQTALKETLAEIERIINRTK